jgi:hypothetical protein
MNPSMSLAVPIEQYRLDYVFLVPDDYATNWVTIVGKKGTGVTLTTKSGQSTTIDASQFIEHSTTTYAIPAQPNQTTFRDARRARSALSVPFLFSL